MNRASLIGGAAVLDAILGDPPALPHPVRAMGAAIDFLDRSVQQARLANATAERVAGAGIVLTVVAATFFFARGLLRGRSRGTLAHSVIEIVAAASTLAWRSLIDEVLAVAGALEAHDLQRARLQLARIVGRDTAHLNESEIARATIEALAESACDGIVAPLFYLAFGGAPLGLAYKAINTMDSMIGHVETPYTHLGWFAAKLDDVANFLPARLSAAFITTASQALRGTGARAASVCVRDSAKHRSPNAGWPEAAIAGALGVRLGGHNQYDGVTVPSSYLGEEFRAPGASDVRGAIRIVTLAAALAAATAIVTLVVHDATA